jgi:hypothetical protein
MSDFPSAKLLAAFFGVHSLTTEKRLGLSVEVYVLNEEEGKQRGY